VKRVNVILALAILGLAAMMLVKGGGIVQFVLDGLAGPQAWAQGDVRSEAAGDVVVETEGAAEVKEAKPGPKDTDGETRKEKDGSETVQRTVPMHEGQAGVKGDPNGPATSSDPVQEPKGQPADTGSAPTDSGEKAPSEPAEPMEAINLNNVEMRKIMQTLGEWTGKPIIPTSDEIMNTKITIYATKQVPRSQAMNLIISALKAKGVILEQQPDRILLKPLAAAKIGSVPTLAADEPLARITDKSQIVEKFFKLTNYSPSRLMTIISPFIADYGHITALEDTKQVAVIDSVENLLRVERIIRQLDVPEVDQVLEEIFMVEHGDPMEMVQILQLILDTERRSRAASRVGVPSGGPGGGGSPGGSARPPMSVTVPTGEIPVRLIPIPKHNWIIARASAADMEQIRGWIAKLDRSQTVPSEQTIVQLKYVDAREVATIIENTLQNMPGSAYRTSVVVQPLSMAKQVVIFGSEENRKMVERLIAEVDLPIDDSLMEKTFKLKFADPETIKQNIEGLYGEGTGSRSMSYYYYEYSSMRRGRPGSAEDSFVRAIAYPTQQAVTVIASEKNIAKIERQIVDEWDVPIDIQKDQYRILSLNNSDPVEMVNLLTKLFSEQGDSSRDLLRLFFFGGRTDTQKKIVGSLYGMLTFEPVPGTKKIIVISKIPEAYDVIERLVRHLDSEEKAEVPRVITLNYADAEDLCDQFNAILNESGTLATINRSTRGLSAYSGGGDSDSAVGRAGTSNATENAAGVITPWWTRQRTDADEGRPTSNLIGKVRFIPVARSKAILVLAPPEYISDIERMIAELDQPGMQVMIKVVIVEVDHASMTSLGVQLSSNPQLFSNLGPGAFKALTDLTAGFTRGSLSAVSGSSTRMMPFGFSAGLNIDVLVEALTKTINAKVLNQPTLWTKDNQEAIFVKGQRVAFIQQKSTDRQTTGSTVETFTYDDVGLTLRVRPNITPEKAVDMSINLIVSQVGENVNNQLATNQLDTTTHIIVNDGQTILLGGILFQNDNRVINKVPLLGDLPLFGGLFRHTHTTLRNNELLAFVTPYVMDANTLMEIPADTDDSRQLHDPRKKMDKVQRELRDATDWMSAEIIREMEQTRP